MIASHTFAFVIAAVGSAAVLAPVRSDAQWWRSSPVDFDRAPTLPKRRRPKRKRPPRSPSAIRNTPAAASPVAATPITTSCRTGPSTSQVRTRRRKSRRRSTSSIPRTSSANGATIAAAQMAKQQLEPPPAQEVQQVSLRTESSSTARNRKGACAGREPGQASRAYQGGAMRQEPVLMRMAAALREHQRTETAVQPAAAARGQTEAKLEASVVLRARDPVEG